MGLSKTTARGFEALSMVLAGPSLLLVGHALLCGAPPTGTAKHAGTACVQHLCFGYGIPSGGLSYRSHLAHPGGLTVSSAVVCPATLSAPSAWRRRSRRGNFVRSARCSGQRAKFAHRMGSMTGPTGLVGRAYRRSGHASLRAALQAERNVLPLLNNLLENREMALEDRRFLVSPERGAQLGAGRAAHLVPVHRDFLVVALCGRVGRGNPLDPPLRSRFSASLGCARAFKPKGSRWEFDEGGGR